MKTKWEFQFNAIDFRFEREYKYKARSREILDFGNGEIENLEFDIEITPSKRKPPPSVAQIGSLFITLPFDSDAARPIAYNLAVYMAQKISFQSGQFEIEYGFVSHELIPETAEEKEEIGDKTFSLEMHLIEDLGTPTFDSQAFTSSAEKAPDLRLLAQFNETKADSSNIRKFLGFFRILESLYETNNAKESLKKTFKTSSKMRMNYETFTLTQTFDDFVDTIVDIRHRCAHLKLSKEFGYAPLDPKVDIDLEPYVPILQMLTKMGIEEASP